VKNSYQYTPYQCNSDDVITLVSLGRGLTGDNSVVGRRYDVMQIVLLQCCQISEGENAELCLVYTLLFEHNLVFKKVVVARTGNQG